METTQKSTLLCGFLCAVGIPGEYQVGGFRITTTVVNNSTSLKNAIKQECPTAVFSIAQILSTQECRQD